ncbi:hypothetical protein ACW73L_05030 [Methylolobus aquaticus]|nr:hypothetical protein EWI61_10565 [Methylolobus aquaticus]
MSARAKCLAALTVLALLGIGPIPTTTLLGFYVVLRRPRWFRDLIADLYAEAEKPRSAEGTR